MSVNERDQPVRPSLSSFIELHRHRQAQPEPRPQWWRGIADRLQAKRLRPRSEVKPAEDAGLPMPLAATYLAASCVAVVKPNALIDEAGGGR